MPWRSRSAEYSGLIAAPGTPKACEMPSFSITSTAAMAAFILAIESLLERLGGIGLGRMVAASGPGRNERGAI